MNEKKTFQVPYLGQYTTSYLIRTEHYNVFIDSAIKSNEEALKPYLEGNRENIVLLTHGHWDHIGCNGLIKKNGGRVFANRNDLPWLTDFDLHWQIGFGQFLKDVQVPPERKTTFWSEIGEMVEIDRFLEDGEELHFDDLTLQVVAIPGHSKGSIGYFNPEENLLYTGDALMETGFFGGLAQYYDAESYRYSMEKIIALDPETVLTAHTPAYERHSAAAAAETAIEFSRKIEADVICYVENTSGPIRIGDLAKEVCLTEGKKVGCGACICVMNHLLSLQNMGISERFSAEGYLPGI